MEQEVDELTLIEGAVLGLLVQQPRHGFALARQFVRDHSIGRVFNAQPPVVYRALRTLEQRGLTSSDAPRASTQGPSRTVKHPTAAGRAAFEAWLATPVGHMRDVRLELLVKLALHDELDRDPRPLLEAQLALLRKVHVAAVDRPTPPTWFDQMLAVWRTEVGDATFRFLERALAQEPSGTREGSGSRTTPAQQRS